MPQRCQQLCCQKGASFGPKDSKTPRYCATHKPVGYVNVKTQCQEDGCYKFPHFGFPGSKATSCVTHMKEGMIHLRVRKRLEPTQMIDIQTKLCKYPGCQKKALFSVEGSLRTFCGQHKQGGMINVASRKCAHSDCYARPYFNVPGKTQGQCCARHKTAGMVNVVNQRCEKACCMTIPTFNLLGEKSARFCEAHRNPGMINVVGPKCNNINCQKRALYGIPGYKMSRCFTHKDKGMIAQSSRLCMISDCKKPATHGLSNPTRCEKHSTDNMIDLVQKICSNCGLLDILFQDQKCAECNTYAEAKVRRPDFVIDAGTHQVVLEVDEYQHKKGEYNCEIKRMWDIAQALGIPTFFIRYNPDSYRIFNGITKDSNDKERKKELLM
ncbi:13049_t:CDS:2 [Funneliformis geosporum]|uniref:10169_t:CDS:1 n=1 Tax=Funneliformis geosporum TaxID=1117311 RepID=A0A9W4SQE6_9GLOM|nr:13049_t:CDS:2 [Funneliformis geosporum]CAI2178923.1 10169_t:CDS:2 [Funneliformis geosporum]